MRKWQPHNIFLVGVLWGSLSQMYVRNTNEDVAVSIQIVSLVGVMIFLWAFLNLIYRISK